MDLNRNGTVDGVTECQALTTNDTSCLKDLKQHWLFKKLCAGYLNSRAG